MLPLMQGPWYTFKPQPQQSKPKPKPRLPNEGDRKRYQSQKPKTPPCLWVKCPTCGNDSYPLDGFCHVDHLPYSRKGMDGLYHYCCFGNKHRFLAPEDSIPRFRAEHRHGGAA